MTITLTPEQAQWLANLLDAEVRRGGLQAATMAGPVGAAIIEAANAERQRHGEDNMVG